MVFLPCMFLFSQFDFQFKSLLNQFLFLKNAQYLQEYCFFLSPFFRVETYNLFYFLLIFCIQITSSCQLFYLIHLSLQYFFRYLFFILLIVFFSYFSEVQIYNLFYFLLIFCIQITSSFSYFILFICFSNISFGTQLLFCLLFFVIFFGGTNIGFILFDLEISYTDNKQFLAILFDLFFCPIFFYILIFFECVVRFKRFQKMFFKKYFLSPLFLLIFVVSFSFSKSVE